MSVTAFGCFYYVWVLAVFHAPSSSLVCMGFYLFCCFFFFCILVDAATLFFALCLSHHLDRLIGSAPAPSLTDLPSTPTARRERRFPPDSTGGSRQVELVPGWLGLALAPILCVCPPGCLTESAGTIPQQTFGFEKNFDIIQNELLYSYLET